MQIIGPVIVPIDKLANTTVRAPVGDRVVISIALSELDRWRAEIADPRVAGFSAGGTRDGARFNPGFEALTAGTTAVTLIGPDEKRVPFTLIAESR